MLKFKFQKTDAVRIVEGALRPVFSDDEIALMARLGTIVGVSSGQTLMDEGTDGDVAFLITSGTASVSRDGDVVAKLQVGDMVGERALVTGEPRNATVTAMMPVTALSFDRKQFGWLRFESEKVERLSADLVLTRV